MLKFIGKLREVVAPAAVGTNTLLTVARADLTLGGDDGAIRKVAVKKYTTSAGVDKSFAGGKASFNASGNLEIAKPTAGFAAGDIVLVELIIDADIASVTGTASTP